MFLLMEVVSIDEAKALTGELPLTAGGFMTLDLTPVGPLAPLGRLIQSK